eukprot:CAMPEP_0184661814 /NCGR_PEP_ID=MMETSP0308-20130426/40314_1 /TAXON_ID=38269 /ORGANISM="Gloeochaete witrockiana, Strain SAG 46.84" /LENGTH=54 /DNA_ID=CAMNT_0027103383 /DNA_START=16 /DNA_END=177 /DNA_ORIENTATION=-
MSASTNQQRDLTTLQALLNLFSSICDEAFASGQDAKRSLTLVTKLYDLLVECWE